MRSASFLRSIINVKTTISKIIFRRSLVVAKPSIAAESSLAYTDSILVLSLVLPSRQETCRFHLNLQTANVGQLIDEIKREDAGIEHVHVYNENAHLLARSYSIKSLMTFPFTIQLNRQRTFLFDPIKNLQIKENTARQTKTEGPSTEDTVAALYHALNVMRVYHNNYLELKKEANELTTQLEPLEKVKDNLAKICQRHVSRCIWYGLAGMSFQVGILAELTWDVYSWDIVEPISYFIAFGTAMTFYAFHLMTRSDFEYIAISDRLFLRKFYREARRQTFNISLYNRLKDRLFHIHTDLARLRGPLVLSLSIPSNPLKCKISGEELSPLNIYRTRERIKL